MTTSSLSWRDRAARGFLLRSLRSSQAGQLTFVDADGEHVTGTGEGLTARIEVHSGGTYRAAVARGSRGVARTYADGLWDCGDLVSMVRIAVRAIEPLDPWKARLAQAMWPLQRARASLRNTKTRSRQNVELHYDLGNDFFSLVLDDTMGYSCAYYAHPGMAAVEASRENFDRICRSLDLRPGERLLEIGSGWGPLALHAAKHFRARVSTVTLSESQRDYIDKAAADAGVGDLVEVLVQDYRDVRGTWDKLAAIEVVESLGAAHLETFASQVWRLLRPDGLAFIQVITTADRFYKADRYGRSFLNEYIFPGGFAPSVEALLGAFAKRTSLRPVAVYDITAHYPPTLRAWRDRLQENWPRIAALGRFDEPFRRLWTLYFSWCEAAFIERRVQDRQVLLAGPRWHDEDRLLGLGTSLPEVDRRPLVEDGERFALPDPDQEMQPA